VGRSVASFYRKGRRLLAGLVLGVAVAFVAPGGDAVAHQGVVLGPGFESQGGHHDFKRGDRRGRLGGRHGSGRHRGAQRFSQGHVIIPDHPGLVYRGPLGFEQHRALREARSNRHGDYTTISGNYAHCSTVWMDTYVNGWPATVSALLCHDEYGNPYLVTAGGRLVKYYD
jgi:hypothetical protein